MSTLDAKVTLLDKRAFVRWAVREHRLSRSQHLVLEYLVETVAGLDGAKPYNGWATAAVLAGDLGLNERTIRRALERLGDLDLIRCVGHRGRGGRTTFHIAGLQGAAERHPPPRIGHGKAAKEAGENRGGRPKIGQDCPIKTAENRAAVSPKIGQRRPMTSLEDHPRLEPSPLDRAAPKGAARESAALGFENEEGGEGLRQGALRAQEALQGGVAPTQARERLMARLQGIARKHGGELPPNYLAVLGEPTAQRWLAWQRKGRERKLFGEAIGQISAYLQASKVEVGRSVATKAEPPPGPLPPPLPRPFASMAAALAEPEHNTKPHKRLEISRAEMLASAARLGIPLKAGMETRP